MQAEARTSVIQVIAAIPLGKVCSYGRVARLAGLPNHARYVGTVLRQLPSDSTLPWHRVVNSTGQISFPEGSEKYQLQRTKLEREGVLFHNNKIPLQQYLW
jgi:methylated-DNA-protein-cysteine methyltransferase-like protein